MDINKIPKKGLSITNKNDVELVADKLRMMMVIMNDIPGYLRTSKVIEVRKVLQKTYDNINIQGL